MLTLCAGCLADHSESSRPISPTTTPQPTAAAPVEDADRIVWPSAPPAGDNPRENQAPPATPTIIPTTTIQGDPVFISPADPRIRYLGRFDFRDPERPLFDWSATAIEIAFSGTSLAVTLEDVLNFYNVEIDGQLSVLETSPDENTYVLADNLAPGQHRARMTKRTEAYVGAARFLGFILDPGQNLQPLPTPKERLIEFIGDSITTGYGNEGDSPTCWFTPGSQNVSQAYAGLIAGHFEAEYNIIALSGLGVIRNLRDSETSSPETAVDFLDRALAMNPASIEPAAAEELDIVLVNLGTNDFSSLPFPQEEDFVTAYTDLLAAIHQRYPQVPIVAVAGPLMLDPAPAYIERAVNRYNAAQETHTVTFALVDNNLEQSAVDFGCDWHPNIHGHRKIADQLIPVIGELLNW